MEGNLNLFCGNSPEMTSQEWLRGVKKLQQHAKRYISFENETQSRKAKFCFHNHCHMPDCKSRHKWLCD